MFLFIKKCAKKQEGKSNMKPVLGQRGENVVGAWPFSTPLQLLGWGWIILLRKGTERSLPKVLWLCQNKALSVCSLPLCSKHELSACCLLHTDG